MVVGRTGPPSLLWASPVTHGCSNPASCVASTTRPDGREKTCGSDSRVGQPLVRSFVLRRSDRGPCFDSPSRQAEPGEQKDAASWCMESTTGPGSPATPARGRAGAGPETHRSVAPPSGRIAGASDSGVTPAAAWRLWPSCYTGRSPRCPAARPGPGCSGRQRSAQTSQACQPAGYCHPPA